MPPKKGGNSGPGLGSMLNLERVPMLAPKFSNKLGKTAAKFSVEYSVTGVTVNVESILDSKGKLKSPTEIEEVSLIEFERRLALYNTPSTEEKLSSFKRKYELRLMEEFPSDGPSDGKDESIQAFLNKIPFEKRVALLKSQKDFDKSYPNGFRGGPKTT
jgi:hypothetical protein